MHKSWNKVPQSSFLSRESLVQAPGPWINRVMTLEKNSLLSHVGRMIKLTSCLRSCTVIWRSTDQNTCLHMLRPTHGMFKIKYEPNAFERYLASVKFRILCVRYQAGRAKKKKKNHVSNRLHMEFLTSFSESRSFLHQNGIVPHLNHQHGPWQRTAW